MRFKQALLCLSVCTALALAGLPEDSLSFPELLSPHYFEELEGTARFILQFRLRNDYACKSICHIDHGPFSFYLRSSEEQGTLRTSAGLSFASKHWQAGIGRGRPHIARGRILGNTMMGFSADPRNNYRIGRGNIRIRNYDYYPSLIYLGGEYGGVSLTAMLMSAVPVIISRLERKTFSTGLELFLTQPAILETWTEYRAAFWRERIKSYRYRPVYSTGPAKLPCGRTLYRPFFSRFYDRCCLGNAATRKSRALRRDRILSRSMENQGKRVSR
jgi:hypothetical protein